MSGAIMNKVWDLFGMDTAEEKEDENVYNMDDEYNQEDEEVEEKRVWGKRNNICDLLKEKKSVIVNLEYVNKDVARRIVDVISGAVHALDGHIQKISNSIFLIAPYNYDITTDMAREEIKNKLSVSWLRNNGNE